MWRKLRGEGKELKTNIYKLFLKPNFSDPLRLTREQQRQVSKVLLDGLYDPDSPISKLLGVHIEVLGENIWQKMLARNWQYYADPDNPAWL